MGLVTEGTFLWEGSEEFKNNTRLNSYMNWLRTYKNLSFSDYEALWNWSVNDLDGFWESIWEFFAVKASKPYTSVLASREMPGAKWFAGAELNYVEQVFRHRTQDRPVLLFQSEITPLTEISWDELYRQVSAVAAWLRNMGVRRGDRVVGYMPNIPEAVVAFLASASIGAIWSSCSLDFGSDSIIDRFKQIEPKVLIAVDGYRYNGKAFDRRPVIRELIQSLPSLQQTVLVPYLFRDGAQDSASQSLCKTLWPDILAQTEAETLEYEQVPFDHPLWILYSSGTTGLPKPIVQSQGGILLEHLKSAGLQLSLEASDRFFWYTTTGWMMWNFLVGGLLVGATVLLYDGSPGYPDLGILWEFAEKTGMTVFGTSASYILSCLKAGLSPGKQYDLRNLKAIGSTGSPLPPEGFQWVYDHVKADIWLASVSGGTDLCTAFVGGAPLLPVHAGMIQCRCLGAKVEAFDEAGHLVIGDVGELVITEPMPSMPLYFWNDPGDKRYRESYFDMYPNAWRHGDWIKIDDKGRVVIYGRSDSTINRSGIRMGTSEIYRAVEAIEEVMDSLVVDIEVPGENSRMYLFVVLKEGAELTEHLQDQIRNTIRTALSPRHVPDMILEIAEVPRTLNGKKMEVPIKKILKGFPLEKAVNKDSMSNPGSLDYFVEFAKNFALK
jgi:acetoacetyl-CoA synthetase